MVKVAPSILSADFTKLGEDITSIRESGCEWVHFDVMDGLFVPNITVGVPVLKSVRKFTDMFLDVHLMIKNPQNLVSAFCDAGADMLTAHIEAADADGLNSFIETVKNKGKLCALSVKPATSYEALVPYLENLDMILVMTVNPGFGGQSFMPDQLEKISRLAELRKKYKPELLLEVDGGINPETGRMCVQAGCDVLVAGSYFFGSEDRKLASELLHKTVE